MLHHAVRTQAPHVVQNPLLLHQTVDPWNEPCCKAVRFRLLLLADRQRMRCGSLGWLRRQEDRHSAWRCQHMVVA